MTPKLEETIYLDFVTSANTGAAVDADSTPSAEVFEDATDTSIVTPTVAKRTGKTGNYRIALPCTAANGFEEGKSYNVVVSATVGTIAAKSVVDRFQVRTTSNQSGDAFARLGAPAGVSTAADIAAKSGSSPLKRIRFDNGIQGDLALTFSRAVATCDPLGVSVPSNTPRYERAIAVASGVKWTNEVVNSTSQKFLGSGYDHDGITPLVCWADTATNSLKIVRGTDLTSVTLSRDINRSATQDIAFGTALQSATYRYSPLCGRIVHGLIEFLCQRTNISTGNAEGVTIFAMQASSITATDWFSTGQFQKVTDVQPLGNVSTYYGGSRLREWAGTNYFPDANSPILLGAWMPGVDYYGQTAPGGQAWVYRVSRTAPGAQWSIGTFRLVWDSVQDDAAVTGHHVHSAGVVVVSASAITLVVSSGDGYGINRNRRFFLNDNVSGDIKANYATATATRQNNFHGDTNRYANQWAAIAPGPTWGSLIVTGDEVVGTIYEITNGGDPSTTVKANIRLLHGVNNFAYRGGSTVNRLGLWVQCLAPERGGPWLVREGPGASAYEVADALATRLLYSKDGRTWAPIGNLPAGTSLSTAVPFFIGRFKIGCTNSNAGAGIFTTPVPQVYASPRGMKVGPGGTQYARQLSTGDGRWGITATQTGVVFTHLTKSATSSKWQKPAALGGGDLPTQPPCLGAVIYFDGVLSVDQFIGILNVGDTNASQKMSAGALHGMRYWFLPAEDGAAMHIYDYDGNSVQDVKDYIAVQNDGIWTPVENFITASSVTAYTQTAHINTLSTGVPSKGYLALDILTNNEGLPRQYPMAVPTVGTALAASPHEIARINGFNASATNWLFAAAVRIPIEGVDASAGTSAQTEEVVACIYASSGEHVDIVLDLANKTALCRIYTGSTLVATITLTNVVVMRNDLIQFAVSRSASGTSFVWSNTNGDPADSTGVKSGASTSTIAAAPIDLRFSNSVASAATDIASLIVLGAVVAENGSYDQSRMTSLVTSGELLAPVATANVLRGGDGGGYGVGPGDTFIVHFSSFHPATGRPAVLDPGSWATLVRNGVDTGVGVTITAGTDGANSASGVIPSIWSTGDIVAVKIEASVAGAPGVLPISVGRLDAAVSTRLATTGYTTPPTAVQNRQEMDANSTKLDATVGSRATQAQVGTELAARGITSSWSADVDGQATSAATNALVAATQSTAGASSAATAATQATTAATQTTQQKMADALKLAPTAGTPAPTSVNAVLASIVTDGVPSTGGGESGDGNIAVTQDTGGTDNLRYVYNSVGVDEATVRAYLKGDYDANLFTVRGRTYTGTDGRWVRPMMLDAGTYRFTFDAPGYQLATMEATVS